MVAGEPVSGATLAALQAGWQTFANPILYQQTAGTRAAISRTITRAVWIERSGLIHAQVDLTAGASSSGGASVSLPKLAVARQLVVGTAAIMGASAPTQSGVAYMSSTLDSIIVVAFTNAFCDIANGQSFRYSVTYQPA